MTRVGVYGEKRVMEKINYIIYSVSPNFLAYWLDNKYTYPSLVEMENAKL